MKSPQAPLDLHELHGLVESAFTPDHFRRWLQRFDARLEYELPAGPIAPADLYFVGLKLLIARGINLSQIFERLCKEFPRRFLEPQAEPKRADSLPFVAAAVCLVIVTVPAAAILMCTSVDEADASRDIAPHPEIVSFPDGRRSSHKTEDPLHEIPKPPKQTEPTIDHNADRISSKLQTSVRLSKPISPGKDAPGKDAPTVDVLRGLLESAVTECITENVLFKLRLARINETISVSPKPKKFENYKQCTYDKIVQQQEIVKREFATRKWKAVTVGFTAAGVNLQEIERLTP